MRSPALHSAVFPCNFGGGRAKINTKPATVSAVYIFILCWLQILRAVLTTALKSFYPSAFASSLTDHRPPPWLLNTFGSRCIAT
jgi:hypothetical protein